ncbi:tyrosine-protein phosphatase [Pseudomaricurvus sp. HS19]|uniref:tyrosine-protein phosphatase n=1 Tax=Pseudomaricurvus sp. HS19 TaxID=2692626 RepID=UPI0013694494|nr:tyrosine-protein phosphatase [Pseudomaricurvus sp. HS19]MYM63256.1 protein-tyrosine-phosphatase [Pseudomaricurvus sp. HS19]
MAIDPLAPSRVVPLEGGINFRDLGGYETADGEQVRWRKLFRCGHLADLSAADIRVLEQLGISQVHDFRRQDEQAGTPSQPLAAATINDYDMSLGSLVRFWELLRAGQLSGSRAHELVVDSYHNGAGEVAPHYRRLFQALLDNRDQATLFHCAAGKDRTGLAAALILSALGVSRQQVVEDYLLTRDHFDAEALIVKVEGHLRRAGVSEWERGWLEPYCSVHEDNIEAFFDGISRRYGTLDHYLRTELGLEEAQRQQLREAYLER